jgi:hypothetical protein
MRIKDTFDLQDLVKYGFFRVTAEECESRNIDHGQVSYFHWMKVIDYCKTGQAYCYLIQEEDRRIGIYATFTPTGFSGCLEIDDTLLELKEADAI